MPTADDISAQEFEQALLEYPKLIEGISADKGGELQLLA